ncbi:cytochrome P450 [Phytohabitans flavus]|nr:cytochrome P450 [Phytohabitans flavus]
MDIPEARLSVQSLDPPEHADIRHLLVAALHERSPAAMRREVSTIARSGISALTERAGTVDLVSAFARPVALRTICAYLGIDAPDGSSFEACSNAIVRSMDAGLDPDRAEPGDRARAELSALITDQLRTADDRGFVGLAREAARQRDVPAAVLANSLRAVLHAGYESVSRLLGGVLARLVGDPDLLAAAETPPLVDALVDETIRLDGPVQADARACVTDCLVGEQPVRRGDVLVLFLAAANRDPEVFTAPDTVDLTRARGTHLAFGRGAHACLGAALATLQLREVLIGLQAAGVGFVPSGATTYEPTATLRGVARLPVLVRAPGRLPNATGSQP